MLTAMFWLDHQALKHTQPVMMRAKKQTILDAAWNIYFPTFVRDTISLTLCSFNYREVVIYCWLLQFLKKTNAVAGCYLDALTAVNNHQKEEAMQIRS